MMQRIVSRALDRKPELARLFPRSMQRNLRTGRKLRAGLFARNHYAYLVLEAGRLARALGHRSTSVIEFGVAGGNGLLLLEDYARTIGSEMSMQIDVYGFDAGSSGMPQPVDYRDCPHIWSAGFYKMDEAALRARLTTAKLVIGEVAKTVKDFAAIDIAPIGGISFDLDYYSSTVQAFEIFNPPPEKRLPRIHLYFDDIIGTSMDAMSLHTGEMLAISEFNAANDRRKIDANRSLLRGVPKPWERFRSQMYVFHDFAHPDYTKFVGTPNDRRDLVV